MKNKLKKILKVIGMALFIFIIGTIAGCFSYFLTEAFPTGSVIVCVILTIYLAYNFVN